MLQVNNLYKRYGGGTGFVVNDVSFEVNQGEFFTLLGPSGCGKTTTLRSIAGLEVPNSGTIAIDGQPVFSDKAHINIPVAERDISMVFQSYAIWPHMTVYGNVAFPLEAMGARARDVRPRVMEALEMGALADFADRPAPQLSGGQQQRVALARAIVKHAKVLLLDEPLSNLDAKLREQMRVELRGLQRRIGTTTIYVTHDQDEALSLSDRVALMRDGVVVELGTPTELYLTPRHPFTARFVGQADLFPASLIERVGPGARVTTEFGDLACDTFLAGSGAAALLIRPEHVVIGAEANAKTINVVRGRIDTVAFSGKLVDYIVEVGQSRLRVQVSSREMFAAGSEVNVHLPPERCVVLNAESAGGAAGSR